MSGAAERPTTEPAPNTPPRPKIVRRSNRGTLVGVGVVLAVVIILVVVGLAQGWFTAKHPPPVGGACPIGEQLTGAGANFILALASKWTSQYQTTTGTQVNYQGTGSGAGVTALTKQAVDFAASDAPLNLTQRHLLPSPVLTLPVTAGALAIVYNLPGLSQPINLSGGDIASIYFGKITHWNDPSLARNNSGLALPSQTIVAVHRSDAAGTTFVLTDFLSQDSPAWKGGPGKGLSVSWPSPPTQIGESSNSKLANYITAKAYSIGYVDLTDVLSTPGLSYANVLNPSGAFVRPTLADSAAAIATLTAATTFPTASGDWGNVTMVNSGGASDYPLSTFAYFYVYQHADQGYQASHSKAEVLVHWLTWVVSTGQAASAALNYVPLPAAAVAVAQAGISSMSFNGQAVPSCT
jgi:phosphate transport system substrate-binding protein